MMAVLEKIPKEKLFFSPDQCSWQLGNQVHVWKFPVSGFDFSLLTKSEKEFTGRFRFEGDRNRYATGRQALRTVLSKYLTVSPGEVGISDQRNQKPYIISPSSQIQFNISHSGEWVLIALANLELGVDIEKINPEFSFRELLEDHFSEAEQTFISESANPVSAFYYLWTRKESLTKAWGTGLQENLKQVSVLDAIIEKGNKFWNVRSFNLAEDYMAAVSFPDNLNNIIFINGIGFCSTA
jgi:4'-phosphopantetheinyl transferase